MAPRPPATSVAGTWPPFPACAGGSDTYTHGQTRVADLASLRITDVATGPNPAGGSIPLRVGGSASPAIGRAVRFGTAWHPINPARAWLQHTGLPALHRESQRADVPLPVIVPRIKFRPAAAPAADPDRPPGAGTITQITADVRFLAGLGADLTPGRSSGALCSAGTSSSTRRTRSSSRPPSRPRSKPVRPPGRRAGPAWTRR